MSDQQIQHRVVIVDDDTEKIRQAEDMVFYIFGEAAEIYMEYLRPDESRNKLGIVDAIQARDPTILILDDRLAQAIYEEINGLEIARLMRLWDPALQIIIFSPRVVVTEIRQHYQEGATTQLFASDKDELRRILTMIEDGQ